MFPVLSGSPHAMTAVSDHSLIFSRWLALCCLLSLSIVSLTLCTSCKESLTRLDEEFNLSTFKELTTKNTKNTKNTKIIIDLIIFRALRVLRGL